MPLCHFCYVCVRCEMPIVARSVSKLSISCRSMRFGTHFKRQRQSKHYLWQMICLMKQRMTHMFRLFFTPDPQILSLRLAILHSGVKQKKTKNPNAKMSLDLLDPSADEHNEAWHFRYSLEWHTNVKTSPLEGLKSDGLPRRPDLSKYKHCSSQLALKGQR